MNIRNFCMDDYESVIFLWTEAPGMSMSVSESRAGIAHILKHEANIFLVAEHVGEIVGAIMGLYEGRRGWINHLAVSEAYQGRGLGSQLMQEVEARLRAEGCVKVNLLVAGSNAGVQSFYRQLGYENDDVIFMEKWLQ
jgi:ribosomal protein S18 acetylase RimI-like enzyme